ncbi:PREDICTED: adenomatous polyposis coli protein-like [Ceratosolen solmsi marchali]|uniref:Adenomatous polyposis coli protein-like n=1 Tax=Ceratosolen solmsi marchali TaxID=326594 RepID=A0AAJ6YPF6_9HYME|nr:PREDICTED: adenomatous polyposis coli protein-like [Ceratosolen solmsi marchali]
MTAKVARHASKKASTSVNINNKLYFFSNFIEADYDQPTNYSLLYAEENSVIEEVSHIECLPVNSEQESTITTYTKETSHKTSLNFSTSTSTTDLPKLDNIKLYNIVQIEPKDCAIVNETTNCTEAKSEKLKEINQLKSYMEFGNKDKECGGADGEIYLPDDAEDFDDKCNEERLEKIINVTPSQSPVELCKDRDGKIVTFVEDRFSEQTPLMFSRCSSLGSLSGCDQQSLHDDRSSVVSDFSRGASEVVSPSELPDSPAQLVFSSVQQKDKKLGRKKIQQRDKIQSSEMCSFQQEISKRSIFEDDLAIFKEESTPVKFQSVTASSLSSLTIDDDEDVDERDQDEEKILDEYIRKGIAKVTRQHIDNVSSFNLPTNDTYDSNISEGERQCQSDCKSNNSLELFDENSDLTAEEEKLLDECIRRGIAKVTRQNINDVTSLSLRSNLPRISTLSNCEKNEKLEKQQLKHEQPQKRTAICQTE